MNTFRFLHLTDLHLGMPHHSSLWPNVEEMFLDDLERLFKKVGKWDLVVFTGDLTHSGTETEFNEVEKLLQKLWARFKEWGFEPKLLAVPGNHDIVRPADKTDPALINLLHNWNLEDVQNPFWEKSDCPHRNLISNVFKNYTKWWNDTKIPKPANINNGILPGDCSVSINANNFNLGIVGLNSTYLQLAPGDFEKKLNLDVCQLNAVCNGRGADWTKQHDLCLLATHHPSDWLSDDSSKHFNNEIYSPPERFSVHLFGHMHEAKLTTASHGGGGDRRQQQAASLFGLECWGDNKEKKRKHGYSLCELKFEDDKYTFRVWPRRASEKQDGGRKLVRDDSFDLNEDDGGTKSIILKSLNSSKTDDKKTVITIPPDSKPASSYGPHNTPFFIHYKSKGKDVIGRAEALNKVRQVLTSSRRTAIGQAAVFQGLGGLGKTQLAVEYAYQYKDSYPNGVIWLTADQDMDAQLVDLATKSNWVAPASEHKLKLEIALHRLRSYSDCLIIFDNLEDSASIKDYMPEPSASPHILVTSRKEQTEFTYIPVDLLSPDQSLQMLIQEAGRKPDCEEDWTAAKEIVNVLGRLPLAIELAGAYLSHRPDINWRTYLELLQHNLKKALPSKISSQTEHEADLYSTLQVSESIIAEEPLLQDILDVLTWSGTAPMSRSLLAVLIDREKAIELVNALSLGESLRILQHTPQSENYAIHRLVREVRREKIPIADRLPWAENICRRLGDWFENLREDFNQLLRYESEIDHLREWQGLALRFVPQHASRLTWLQAYPPFHRGQVKEVKKYVELALDEYKNQDCDNKQLLAYIYNDLAYAQSTLGNPKHALALAEQSLTIRRELFGEKHPDTATSLGSIAHYMNELGNPKRALELAEQALTIQRELLGNMHPDIAKSLNNIAGYTDTLGNPKQALELAEQALAIRRELFGEKHPDIATSLNSIASHTNILGNPKRALELAEQAIAIRRELFGEIHPDIAASLNNIASYTNALGNPKQALELAEQALTIRRELFGKKHPDIATSLNNIALYTSELGNPKRALELAEQALAIRRELFGDKHPNTTTSLSNIALYTSDLGNPKRALELAEQALAIQCELFGEKHPNTATSLSNIALYTSELGNPKRALELAEQSLAIRRELFGEKHPDIATALNNIASYTSELGNPKRALELAEQALAIQCELFGEKHPDIALSLNNIAGYISELGNPKRALELAEQALAIRRELFGEKHQSIAACLNNIATYTKELDNPTRALELTEQAYSIQLELFGKYHPNTAACLNNIASCTRALGNPQRALELAEQALAIQLELFGDKHPHTAICLNNIAGYMETLGNPKQALELAEQALAIRRELFGEKHLHTANSLHNVAFYLSLLGKKGQAYEYAKKAFEIRKEILGMKHKDTLSTIKFLSKLTPKGFRLPPAKVTKSKKKKRK